ncbi:MAG TPA: MazG nucleotide pyrophosphohydrolase domain-containing protein [Candidatus Sulfotelmatobacter sp.]|jgi:NTP pyrophosphatase (non-canonical NTP hydrolase)|nr:MazG nucleotide pyrophosphohydrolase domain-containing protein [Candidatus Sulfotelmatobacter sp.]
MEFNKMFQRAITLRKKYAELEIKKRGKAWTNAQMMEGFVVDVGELMEIVMAKEGARDMENVDEKLAHELSDCLWSVLVLADKYSVNLEQAFQKTMDSLEKRIDEAIGE